MDPVHAPWYSDVVPYLKSIATWWWLLWGIYEAALVAIERAYEVKIPRSFYWLGVVALLICSPFPVWRDQRAEITRLAHARTNNYRDVLEQLEPMARAESFDTATPSGRVLWRSATDDDGKDFVVAYLSLAGIPRRFGMQLSFRGQVIPGVFWKARSNIVGIRMDSSFRHALPLEDAAFVAEYYVDDDTSEVLRSLVTSGEDVLADSEPLLRANSVIWPEDD